MKTGSSPERLQVFRHLPESSPRGQVFSGVAATGWITADRRAGPWPPARRPQACARGTSHRSARPDKTWRWPDVPPCAPCARFPESPARAGCARYTPAGGGNGAKPARTGAPESAVIQALRVPPCRFRQSRGAKCRSAPRLRAAGSPPHPDCLRRRRAKRSSTTTPTRRSGRARCRMSSAGVVSTQSPSDRSRTTATRLAGGRDPERFPLRPYSSIFASSTSITGISSRIG